LVRYKTHRPRRNDVAGLHQHQPRRGPRLAICHLQSAICHLHLPLLYNTEKNLSTSVSIIRPVSSRWPLAVATAAHTAARLILGTSAKDLLEGSSYLPEVLHAVHVVIQKVGFRDAHPLQLGNVGHTRPLVVGDPPPLVREVEAVRVLALDEREPAPNCIGIASGV